MNSNINKLIPNLRFPEFRNEGEWKEETLGGACEMQAGKFVDASDIKTKPTEGLFPCYGGNGLRGFTKSYTHIGKFSLIGRQGALCGNITFVEGKFHATEHALVSTPKNDTDTLWLFYVLELLNLNQYATGQAQPGLSVSNLEKVKLAIPSDPKEQKKIALCLSSLDEAIAAHTQKLETLKEHKKGLIQNLFPKEGESVPKMRFPDFLKVGEWKKKNLGELTTKVGSGVTPLGGELKYKKSGRPFVRSQNVGWGILLLRDIAFIDEDTHRESINTEIELQDVLLNITGASIGRSAVADNKVIGGNVNQHVCIIRTIKNILSPNFLCQYLNSSLGQKQIDSYQAGGNRQGLNFVQIRSLSLPVPPTLDEQIKIAECFSSLDDVIGVEAEKINQLKSYKKGLMQGLFPSLNT
jgi:type I restriction enzyme S subunit